MKLIEHVNNNKWWHLKSGNATPEEVSQFAKDYQCVNADAWAVTVIEGANWIGATHVRDVVDAVRNEGALVVWVSNGTLSQVVWRKGVK